MKNGERSANGAVRAARRDELARQLIALGPATAYGGFLGYAQRRGSQKPEGYAAHLFKELYGDWPRQRGQALELDGFLIEEWVGLRPKKKLPPRKLKIVDQPPPQSDLMSAADWEAKW